MGFLLRGGGGLCWGGDGVSTGERVGCAELPSIDKNLTLTGWRGGGTYWKQFRIDME